MLKVAMRDLYIKLLLTLTFLGMTFSSESCFILFGNEVTRCFATGWGSGHVYKDCLVAFYTPQYTICGQRCRSIWSEYILRLI